jgi:hypothetical protein
LGGFDVKKYGTTPGGISLDPAINPLHARAARLDARIVRFIARLDKVKGATALETKSKAR